MTTEPLPRACVVLPTYNEAENIGQVIPRIFEIMAARQDWETHIVVVDDQSPDGTADRVRSLRSQFPRLYLSLGRKAGLGQAYKRGFEVALGQIQPDAIFEMDADLQHDPALLPELLRHLESGADVVIGSRFAPGGATPNFSLWRRFLSVTGNLLIRGLTPLGRIKDCTSGLRCIRASVLSRCNFNALPARGYSFQSTLLLELVLAGAKVVEIPIVFPDRTKGSSKLAARDQLEFLWNIFRMIARRIRDL